MKYFLPLLFISNIFATTQVFQTSKLNTLQTIKLSGKVTDSLFIIDKRLELFNVIQWISKTYPTKSVLKSDYSDDVDKYFGSYRAHEAVTSLDKLISFGFTIDAPVSFFLHISYNLDTINKGLPEEVIKRAGGIKNLDYFLRTIKSFAVETKYDDFFNSHLPYYKSLVNNINSKFNADDIIKQVETFYNKKIQHCKIILSTLTSGGFGPKITDAHGNIEFVTVASPVELDNNNEIEFFDNKETLKALLWHELSHPFVNPLVDKYWNRLSVHKKLINTLEKDAPSWYKDDKAICYENIVRAVTIRMEYIYSGEEDGKKSSVLQAKWGFPYAQLTGLLLNKIVPEESLR